MRKAFLIILFLGVIFIINAQSDHFQKVFIGGVNYFVYPVKQENKYGNDLSAWKNEVIRKHYKYEGSTNGNWVQYYKNDTSKIAKLFSLKDGEINGVYKTFYPNGKNEEYIEKSNGNVNGWWIRWYENGQVMDSIKYRLDTSTVNGYISPSRIYYKKWFENGSIEKIENYDSLGLKNGISYEYFENGQVKSQITYTNEGAIPESYSLYESGVKNGITKIYYKNGQERIKVNYVMGNVVDGFYCEYYSNGNKKSCGKLQNGLKIGKWTEWYENDRIKSEGEFDNGSYIYCGFLPYTKYYEFKIGEWEYYYANGQPMAKGIYKESKKNVETICSRGGAKLKCGKMTKKWICYTDNGEIVNIKAFLRKYSYLEDREVFIKRIYDIE